MERYSVEHIRKAKALLNIAENGDPKDDIIRFSRICQSRGINDAAQRDALRRAMQPCCKECGQPLPE